MRRASAAGGERRREGERSMRACRNQKILRSMHANRPATRARGGPRRWHGYGSKHTSWNHIDFKEDARN